MQVYRTRVVEHTDDRPGPLTDKCLDGGGVPFGLSGVVLLGQQVPELNLVSHLIGLELDEFIAIGVEAMKGIAQQLGL